MVTYSTGKLDTWPFESVQWIYQSFLIRVAWRAASDSPPPCALLPASPVSLSPIWVHVPSTECIIDKFSFFTIFDDVTIICWIWRHNAKISKIFKKSQLKSNFLKTDRFDFLENSSKLICVANNHFTKFVSKSYRYFVSIKLTSKLKNNFPIRAHVIAPWKHHNFGCV